MIRNTPFRVQADHDGADVESFRLVIDGTVVQELPAAALAAGVIEFTVGGHNKGSYTVTVEAVNADGATPSAPLSLVITGTAPAAATNIRVAVL